MLGGELGIKSSVYNLYREDSEIPISGRRARASSNRAPRRRCTGSGSSCRRSGRWRHPSPGSRADVYYNQELPEEDLLGTQPEQSVSRMLPSAGLDLRWPFVRGTGYGQHVVTPVAQFVTSSDETEEDEIGNEDAIDLNFDTTNLFLHQKLLGRGPL